MLPKIYFASVISTKPIAIKNRGVVASEREIRENLYDILIDLVYMRVCTH